MIETLFKIIKNELDLDEPKYDVISSLRNLGNAGEPLYRLNVIETKEESKPDKEGDIEMGQIADSGEVGQCPPDIEMKGETMFDQENRPEESKESIEDLPL